MRQETLDESVRPWEDRRGDGTRTEVTMTISPHASVTCLTYENLASTVAGCGGAAERVGETWRVHGGARSRNRAVNSRLVPAGDASRASESEPWASSIVSWSMLFVPLGRTTVPEPRVETRPNPSRRGTKAPPSREEMAVNTCGGYAGIRPWGKSK